MFVAGHVAAGALIGQTLGESNPALVFGLSFASHFLLDVIPHGDRHHIVDYFQDGGKKMGRFYRMLMIDTTASIIMLSGLMGFTTFDRSAMAWGVIGSVLPDLLTALGQVLSTPALKWFSKIHYKIHNALIHKIIVQPKPGTIFQMLLIIAMLAAM